MVKILTFDSEEDGFVNEATVVWCICIKDHDDGKLYSYGPDSIAAGLDHLDRADFIVGHNIIGHDLPIFRRLHGYEPKAKLVDTLIMSRTQRPLRQSPPNCPDKRAPHSLMAWGYRLGLYKIEHEDWSQFSPEMLKRCEGDTELNYLVYKELRKEGKGEHWESCLGLSMRLFDLLQRQEEHGWLADRPHMLSCIHQLDRWIERIDRATRSHLPLICEPEEAKKYGEYNWVHKPFKKDGSYAQVAINYWGANVNCVGGPHSRVSFRRVSLDSNTETKTFLLEAGWEPLEWNTNNAGERTSAKLSKDDPFDGVQGSLGRLIAKRVKCRHRKGTIEGLVEVIRPDGTISPGHSGNAATGRLKHRVIVNIPSVDSGSFYGKQMRACFIARPGNVIVGADSKGNQVRQLAARMGDDEFTNVVLFGTKEDKNDLHSFNQDRAGLPTRTLAKNFFYGFIFGAQDKKIGKIMGKDAAAGKVIREEYFARVPRLKELIDRLTAEWEATAQRSWNERWRKWEYSNGYIKGLDGRPILVEHQHTILCYALQSDEAIQMAKAYVLVHDEMARRGYVLHRDWSMLIWYHDEFQAECPEGLANTLGEVMCWAIKEAGLFYNIVCPHEGEFKIGNNWGDTH